MAEANENTELQNSENTVVEKSNAESIETTVTAEASEAPKKRVSRRVQIAEPSTESFAEAPLAVEAAAPVAEAAEEAPKRTTRAKAPAKTAAAKKAAAVEAASSEAAEVTEAAPAVTETASAEPAAAENLGSGHTKRSAADAAAEAVAELLVSSTPKRGRNSARSASSADAESAEDALGSVIDGLEKREEQGEEGESRNRNRNRSRNTNNRNRNNRNDEQGENSSDDSHDDSESEHGEHGDRNDRNNRNRQRDRKRRGGAAEDVDPEIFEDDVLIPVAGILDVLDNYAFVRTTGYLPGTNDIYVSLGQVKKYNLRKGDAVIGSIRQPREGENQGRQKYNALARVDSINGLSPEQNVNRGEFSELTPVNPTERLRLENGADQLSNRVIDLVAPLGKGQRSLIVAPARSGKTQLLQGIAHAISANNPEAHLMVLLVDERPEEVTEVQRAVKGEIIASTFERNAEDHITIAELALERAKRLVEMGHDVVLLLDSLTRLARAYNSSTATAARGGQAESIDSAALHAAKRFFGTARNVEDGGSLTIIATALVNKNSKLDIAILDEFLGAANSEIVLSRELADKRIFPALDLKRSGTMREDLMLGKDELDLNHKLRRALTHLNDEEALNSVLDRVKATSSNVEFLMQVQSATLEQLSTVTSNS
ncbi:MAG: transcription termination factor Rho [Microbacteriaceae bacterium]